MTTLYGVDPCEHRITEDYEHGRIVVSNAYYEIEHALDSGGQIRSIRFPKIRQKNILLEPCRCEISLAGAPKPFGPGGKPKVSVARDRDQTTLTFEGPLVNSDGRRSGVRLKMTFVHRWGHVRVRQELLFPAKGVAVSRVLLHRWVLRPELTHYAVRPGVHIEGSTSATSFGRCQWGRFRPGSAFDTDRLSRYVPRYACFANPGRYGIEWFVGSKLAQWDYQLAGEPGMGSLLIQSQWTPPGVLLQVCPLDLPLGSLRLRGRYEFDSYIGIPIISGRAHRPFLHAVFNRKHWPTKKQVRQWARSGVRTAHFHHDGDYFGDERFWRDGSYPPFVPKEMKAFDRVIAECHRNDIRVATYFSNKELYPSVPAFKDHGTEWARLPDDRAEIYHDYWDDYEFGGQMCLRSGWLDYFKQYVDTVLSNHDLDGTYYDWSVALYCHNARHVGMKMPRRGRLGVHAFSPAGHWDVDELLDLTEWTRRRVGPEGLMILHNTLVPMAATENFADLIVAMEWGYSMLSTGVPDTDELPLEWNFMGARSRGVIGTGCVAKGASVALRKQMVLRCLLTGVAPWPMDDLARRMFSPLRGYDLADFTFHDWRRAAVRASDPAVQAAVYSRPDKALVLAANIRGTRLAARLIPNLTSGAFPRARSYRIVVGKQATRMSAAALKSSGVSVQLPANGLAIIHVEAVSPRKSI